jgi:hypothetical protein
VIHDTTEIGIERIDTGRSDRPATHHVKVVGSVRHRRIGLDRFLVSLTAHPGSGEHRTAACQTIRIALEVAA